jgi:hypothetical protein
MELYLGIRKKIKKTKNLLSQMKEIQKNILLLNSDFGCVEEQRIDYYRALTATV